MDTNELMKTINRFGRSCSEMTEDPCLAMYAVILKDSNNPFRAVEVNRPADDFELITFDKAMLEESLLPYRTDIDRDGGDIEEASETVYRPFIESIDDRHAIGVLDINELNVKEGNFILNFISNISRLENLETGCSVPSLAEDELERVNGFLFVYNIGGYLVYAYQKITKSYLLKSGLLMKMHLDNTFSFYKGPVIRFTNKFDFLILDGKIISYCHNTIIQQFRYMVELQNKAREAVQSFSHLLANSDLLLDRISKQRIRTINRLLGIGTSRINNFSPEQLRERLNQIVQYQGKFQYDGDGKIVINTVQDIDEVLRMFNDEIVVSPLTDAVYESEHKQLFKE